MTEHAVHATNVSKHFGPITALENVSLQIGAGEIFGIIGPNGAGKTTLVNLITGMLAPDSGTVRTLGLDPIRQERDLREIVGVQFQEAELPNLVRTREALELYSSFYRNPRPWQPLAMEWGLANTLGTRFDKLSGGQKQRLFICLALLNSPRLIVLDELTTGLDPQARRQSWDLVRRIRESGTTALLVTHFMDEAEALCDRIALIDKGRIAAVGTPDEMTGGPRDVRIVSFTPPSGVSFTRLEAFGTVTMQNSRIHVTGSGFLMANVAGELARMGVNPSDLREERTSLEEVFIQMTSARNEENAA
jgi:ABC-2 type transport system ATP-binding protein